MVYYYDEIYFRILTSRFFRMKSTLSNINYQKSINLILQIKYKININYYLIEYTHVATNII